MRKNNKMPLQNAPLKPIQNLSKAPPCLPPKPQIPPQTLRSAANTHDILPVLSKDVGFKTPGWGSNPGF